MPLFVAHFRVHGLKVLHASSSSAAHVVFTRNNGGAAPDWIARIEPRDFESVRRLQRLGWSGCEFDLNAALRAV